MEPIDAGTVDIVCPMTPDQDDWQRSSRNRDCALAVLTNGGLDRLRLADPHHDAMARRLVLDHLSSDVFTSLNDALGRVLAASAPALPTQDRRAVGLDADADQEGR